MSEIDQEIVALVADIVSARSFVQQPATFRSAGVEPHELKYCTQKFGVSAEQLKAAVEKAGVVQQRWPSY